MLVEQFVCCKNKLCLTEKQQQKTEELLALICVNLCRKNYSICRFTKKLGDWVGK